MVVLADKLSSSLAGGTGHVLYMHLQKSKLLLKVGKKTPGWFTCGFACSAVLSQNEFTRLGAWKTTGEPPCGSTWPLKGIGSNKTSPRTESVQWRNGPKPQRCCADFKQPSAPRDAVHPRQAPASIPACFGSWGKHLEAGCYVKPRLVSRAQSRGAAPARWAAHSQSRAARLGRTEEEAAVCDDEGSGAAGTTGETGL